MQRYLDSNALQTLKDLVLNFNMECGLQGQKIYQQAGMTVLRPQCSVLLMEFQ